jgi:KipI family sensor histidine kinase inhibitor
MSLLRSITRGYGIGTPTPSPMRFLAAGPHAILVEVDDLAAMLDLYAEVTRRRSEGWAPDLVDVVPGGRTLLLDGLADPGAAARDLRSWVIAPSPPSTSPVISIEVVYDGPDLDDVATQWNVSTAEAVAIHTATTYSVAFCGFSPGFAYLAGLHDDRVVARRPSPRTQVPAGSVAVGGLYTGIYPRPSPGGWQLIGRTEAILWDPDREPAALLHPGRRVRFVPVPS